MKKEFKVGDIVVFEEKWCFTFLAKVLAREKHLFEVEGLEDDVIHLKSMSTNVKMYVDEESIRHATLKEQYLKKIKEE